MVKKDEKLVGDIVSGEESVDDIVKDILKKNSVVYSRLAEI